MKKLLFIFSAVTILFYGCTGNKSSDQPVEYGVIQNPSAEITEGSVVKGWTFDARARNVIHFYDNVAHTGTKSLFIDAGRMASGRWTSKVLLKPWSKYRFSG